jgi:hypothetical protein
MGGRLYRRDDGPGSEKAPSEYDLAVIFLTGETLVFKCLTQFLQKRTHSSRIRLSNEFFGYLSPRPERFLEDVVQGIVHGRSKTEC